MDHAEDLDQDEPLCSPTREIDTRAVVARLALQRAFVSAIPAAKGPWLGEANAVDATLETPGRALEPGESRLVLCVADPAWAAEIEHAVRIHPDMQVEVVSLELVERAARAGGPGVLILDVDVAGGDTGYLIDTWQAGGTATERAVVLTGQAANGRDKRLALELNARSWIRAGKPSILVVALARMLISRA